jgi:hypothetical protein
VTAKELRKASGHTRIARQLALRSDIVGDVFHPPVSPTAACAPDALAPHGAQLEHPQSGALTPDSPVRNQWSASGSNPDQESGSQSDRQRQYQK